jgi:hypothetical protein
VLLLHTSADCSGLTLVVANHLFIVGAYCQRGRGGHGVLRWRRREFHLPPAQLFDRPSSSRVSRSHSIPPTPTADPILSPAVLAQLVARVVRMGQAKPTFIYHLVVSGTIEERLLALRRELAAAAARGDDASAGSGSVSADSLAPADMLRLLEQE